MDAAEGIMLEDQFQRFWMFLEQLLKYRRQARAVLSLKVTEDGDDHRSIFGALKW
jgi:hypothetical protein